MTTAISRRTVFKLGAGALAVASLLPEAARAQAPPNVASENERVVREYYKSWDNKDWDALNALLTDDFTFSSPHGDDHIDKAAFKKKCWDTQVDYINHFDLELVMAKGDWVTVKYLCHTKNGKGFHNVELHRLRNLKVESVECYFGGDLTFPSAVSSQKN